MVCSPGERSSNHSSNAMATNAKRLVLFQIIYFVAVLFGVAQSVKWFDFLNKNRLGGNASVSLARMQNLFEEKAGLHEDRFRRIHRRDVGPQLLARDQGQLWVLKGFDYLQGCPGVLLDFQVFSYAENLYAVVVTKADENNTQIYSYSVEQGCLELLVTLQSKTAFEATIVQFNDEVRIVVSEQTPTVEPYNHAGSPIYLLSFDGGALVAVKEEKLRTDSLSSITTWVQYGIPHLAVSNIRRDDNPADARTSWTQSQIFCASGGYFDECGQIESYNPQKIVHFEVFTKHYLAVANHPVLTDGFNVPTEVLRHNLTTGDYEHLQYLSTKGALDVCFFTLGTGIQADHFLVVVNRVSIETDGELNYDVGSHVYKFLDEKFEPFQALPTREATSCLSYQAEGGEFFLAFTESSGASFYQYDGWSFVSTTQYTQHAMGVGATRFRTFQLGDARYISVANSNPQYGEGNNVFLPRFETHRTLTSIYDEAHTWCQQAQEDVSTYPISAFVNIYRQSVKKNDTDIALNNVTFQNIEVEIVATNEFGMKDTDVRLDAALVEDLQSLTLDILNLLEKLRVADQRHGAAIRSEGQYVVHGPVTISSLSSDCSSGCQARDVNTTQLGDTVLEDLFANVILLSDEEIASRLNVQRVQVDRSIETESLNDKGLDRFLRRQDDLKFSGVFKIEGNLEADGDLSVSGSVNGVQLTRDSMLLKQGDQELDWELQVDELELDNLVVSFINSVDIVDYLSAAVNRTDSFVLRDPVFRNGFSADDFALLGAVNQVNLEEMVNSAMKLEGDQIVSGIHWYSSVSSGTVAVNGTVNEFRIPDDFVLISPNTETTLEGRIVLQRDTEFEGVYVNINIGNVAVSEGQLDLLLKTKDAPQVISGRKTFETVKLSGPATSQSVNEFPSEFFQSEDFMYGGPGAVLQYGSGDIGATILVEKPFFVGEFAGIDLERLNASAVSLGVDTFPVFTSVSLGNSLRIDGDLAVRVVNGISVDDLVPKDSSGIVLGAKKTFLGPVTISEPFTVDETVNGVDLSALWGDSMKTLGDQDVDDLFVITGDVTVGRIQAAKTVIGQEELGDFVRLNDVGSISGSKTFPSLLLQGSTTFGDVKVMGSVDGVDLGRWGSDSLMKQGDQKIAGVKNLDRLNVQGDVDTESIDDFDVETLRDVVLTNQADALNGDLEAGPMVILDLEVEGNIDGVNSNAPLAWLLYDEEQDIAGGVTAEKNLAVQALYNPTWMVNDVNVSDLLFQTYRIDQDYDIDSLSLGVLEADNINVGGTLQGIRIPDDLVRIDSADLQEVKDFKTFEGPVNIHTLGVDGQFAGQDPNILCAPPDNLMSADWTVRGDVIIKAAHSLTLGDINNTSLAALAERAWFANRGAALGLAQQFADVVVDGEVDVKGLVNGVDVEDLYRRYVSVADVADQEIVGVHSFQSAVFVDSLSVEQLETSQVNSVDIGVLDQWTLRKDVEQRVDNRLQFNNVLVGAITLTGLVNDVDIVEDTMRRDRQNMVTGPKTIGALQVVDDVQVCDGCKIDGVDISDWQSLAVLRHGDFSVTGLVSVDSLSVGNRFLVEGLVNDVAFDSSRLMTLTGDQTLNATVRLSSSIPDGKDPEEYPGSIAGRVEDLKVAGLYGDVELDRLFTTSLRRTLANTFPHPVSLAGLSVPTNSTDTSPESTIQDILHSGIHPDEVQKISTRSSSNQDIGPTMQSIKKLIAAYGSELKAFEEVDSGLDISLRPDAIYATSRGLCFAIGSQLLCSRYEGSLFTEPWNLGHLANVSAVAGLDDFAVSIRGDEFADPSDSLIVKGAFEGDPEVVLSVPLQNAADVTGFLLDERPAFAFVDALNGKVLVYVKVDDEGGYQLKETLEVADAKQVKVADFNGSPLLAVLSVTPRAASRIVLYNYSEAFVAWKFFVESQLVSMDAVCLQENCYVAGIAPSAPGSYLGSVVIWRIDPNGTVKRLQRLSIAEALKVSFALLPNGRLSLAVLQCGGLDSVLFHIQQGSGLFKHSSTIRAPGAFDLQVVSSAAAEMALVVAVRHPLPAEGLASLRLFRPLFTGLIGSQFDF